VGNTHEVVHRVDPDCRVVYADNDPMVFEQAGELLAGQDGVCVILGDLRDPDRVLGHPEVRELIDFSQPAGLLMTAVVHFVADEHNPQALLGRYLDALAPGSYLALSHLTDDHKPPRAVREFCRVFDHATEQMHFRSRPDVERLFTGLDLVPPHRADAKGRLCYAGDWEQKTWPCPTATAPTGSTAPSPGAHNPGRGTDRADSRPAPWGRPAPAGDDLFDERQKSRCCAETGAGAWSGRASLSRRTGVT
jgi:S-adenosyl methyltransferase